MSEDDQIAHLQHLLEQHRRNIAIYERQLASQGADHAPPQLFNGIAQARSEIDQLKADLRALGVTVVDQARDSASVEPVVPSSVPPQASTSTVSTGDTHPARTVIITAVLAFLASVLTNIATGVLPESWGPYLWLAWPLAGLVTLISILVAIRANRSADVSSQPATWRLEDRTAMLANVRRTWIDGVLKQSLWNDALLTLRLAERPDAVVRPYGLHLRAANGDAPLPAGTTIQSVYDAQQGALLILGQPGGGKTTLLLELARMLLNRADSDPTHPIPVVFNLATWQEKQTLAAWLVMQLNSEYIVPKKIGQAWINAGVVLPLLDGLDEVAEARRAVCVEAINIYRSEHEAAWATPIVVSCRIREYEALPLLHFHRAIQVQSLTHPEIDAYLRDGGRPLAGVRAVVKDDPTLYELLETPLLLAVTTLAYAGQSATALRQAGDTMKRRQAIFTAFVTRQFEPLPEGKGVDSRYKRHDTLCWLAWLGRQMQTRSAVEFRMDRLQPSWLTLAMQRWAHVAIALIVSLTGMLIVLPIIGLFIGWLAQPLGMLSFGRVNGYSAWLAIGLFGGVFAWLSFIIAGLSQNVFLGDIVLVEQIRWSWSGLWAGLAGWLSVTIAAVILQEAVTVPVAVAGLIPAFALALGVGLSAGQIDTTMKPAQGIRLSIQHAVRIGSLSAAPVMIIGLLGSLIVREGVLGGVALSVLGCGVGVGLGLAKGGHDVVKHYILRLLLKLTGTFPWNITAFLDSCAQRRLVQPIGGGWRFPHNLIRDYFAELELDKDES